MFINYTTNLLGYRQKICFICWQWT